MQSVTALPKQEDGDFGRNFNNLSLETFFSPPIQNQRQEGREISTPGPISGYKRYSKIEMASRRFSGLRR
jgi:hypothetical protein